MLEDHVGLTAPNEPEAHRYTIIIEATVAHRRIESQAHPDGAAAPFGLEQLRDRYLVYCKMIDREFILGIEDHSRVIRKGSTFCIDASMTE
jgi:hypothetical protein